MNIITRKTITRCALKNCCIMNDLCTRATNSQYEDLLDSVGTEQMTDEKITDIVTRIIELTDCERIADEGDLTMREAKSAVAFHVYNEAVITFVDVLE